MIHPRLQLLRSVVSSGLGLNSVLMRASVEGVGFWYLAAKILAAGTVFFVNFLGRKFLVFRA